MALRRARSVDEFVEWVRRAVFEVGDMRDCLEYEIVEMLDSRPEPRERPVQCSSGIRSVRGSRDATDHWLAGRS